MRASRPKPKGHEMKSVARSGSRRRREVDAALRDCWKKPHGLVAVGGGLLRRRTNGVAPRNDVRGVQDGQHGVGSWDRRLRHCKPHTARHPTTRPVLSVCTPLRHCEEPFRWLCDEATPSHHYLSPSITPTSSALPSRAGPPGSRGGVWPWLRFDSRPRAGDARPGPVRLWGCSR